MSKSDSLYLLLGPEEGEKDSFVERLIGKIAKSIGQPPEVHRFYSFDRELPEVLATLRNGALFSPYRIVLLRNVELLKGKKDLDQLAEYAAAPAAQSSLVMFSEEIGRIDRRLERLVPKENKVIFWELFENQKMGWILNFFRKRNIRIDSQATAFLLEMVENNTKELKDICEKLSIFFGEGSEIGYTDVEKILYHSKDENVFTLFDKIAGRDLDAALEVLAKLLLSREADAVGLLAGLLLQMRRLKALKLLIEKRYSYEEAFSRVKITGKRMQKIYAAGAQAYSLKELQAIIQLIARFDYRVRSLGTVLHPTVLQLFLYYLIVKGGSGTFKL
ncbi:MAG: DNA polymerase III subunit delta [Spirochaetaceae bacterium]|nr:MAG: DNA polymerase III subunit delta [Spirochaetaceae bacterium]